MGKWSNKMEDSKRLTNETAENGENNAAEGKNQNQLDDNGVTLTLDDVMGQFNAEDILARPELNKAIQSRVDSTVTKALTTARAKWEQEQADNLDEAKKLEKMNAEQRARYEFNKEKASFEAEKAKFEREQLVIATSKELIKRGLDANFAEYLTASNAETTTANIDRFEQVFNNAVANSTNRKMQGNVPKATTPNKAITLETLKNMSEKEINANWDEVQKVLASNK